MLADLKKVCVERTRLVFNEYLQDISAADLKSAMEYSLLNSGKLLRPLLVYASGSIFDAPLENLDLPASAVEMIHTYSLIHDDLPAMDNADLRRGKATCHKVYGDAMAVLAGDALQALAFEVIASHPAALTADRRMQMIKVLSHAAGPYGMVAGQVFDLDLSAENEITEKMLAQTHQLKTGALFSACVELGRLAATDDDEKHKHALQEFSDCIGLAFQIQDDILDIQGSSAELGKTQGIDATNAKLTYPQLVGIEVAQQKIKTLYNNGITALTIFGDKAKMLKAIAKLMIKE